MNSATKTSISLLQLLKSDGQQDEAWRLFVERYGVRIYQWCLRRHLQPSDAEDVSQNVLVKLAKRMRNFDYDPNSSFRGWLSRVTQNAINDFFNERNRDLASHAQSDRIYSTLEDVAARQELSAALKDVFDMEVFDEAVRRVRNRVNQQRFRAWELAARENLSGAEIGKKLSMKVASVYTAKNQIQKLIQQEIAALDHSIEIG